VLVNKCPDLDYHLSPRTVVCDFEVAVHNAVRNKLGHDISIQGCFFHLRQSTYRKIQELGLSGVYKEDVQFSMFCNQIDSLAFLPCEDVLQGMECLKQIAPPEAEELVHYFDSTYVSGSYRRVGGEETLRVRRIPPRFPPQN